MQYGRMRRYRRMHEGASKNYELNLRTLTRNGYLDVSDEAERLITSLVRRLAGMGYEIVQVDAEGPDIASDYGMGEPYIKWGEVLISYTGENPLRACKEALRGLENSEIKVVDGPANSTITLNGNKAIIFYYEDRGAWDTLSSMEMEYDDYYESRRRRNHRPSRSRFGVRRGHR